MRKGRHTSSNAVEPHPLADSFKSLIGEITATSEGLVIAVVSPHSRSGNSYVARSLAELAAEQFAPLGRRALLIDYDINKQTQAAFFEHSPEGAVNKKLTGPYDATFGTTPFWQVSPDSVLSDGHRVTESSRCGLYLVGESGLAVTRFDWNSIKAGQTVHVVEARKYWTAAKEQFGVVIVDCPAFDRSDIALNIIPDADKTVIVSLQSQAYAVENASLAQTIVDAGGKCAGMILNQGPAVVQSNYGRTG